MPGGANKHAIYQHCGAANGSGQGVASIQAPSLAGNYDHAASEGSYLTQAPVERGLGSSCYCAHANLLDRLPRSPPGFTLGIFSATEIDCHRAAGTLPSRKGIVGEKLVQGPARTSPSERGEVCQGQA